MSTSTTQRVPRLRRLADQLGARHRVPVEPQYEKSLRSWTLRWYDGPTVATVRAELARAGTEARGVAPRRDLSTRALVLGAIRQTRDGALRRWVGSWGQRYHLEQMLADTAYPDRTGSAREAAMLERLLEAATTGRGRWAVPDENKAFELIARDGIAWLLPTHRLAAPEESDGLALNPLEYLTERYATEEDRTAWETSLAPMPLRAAVLAARADARPAPEVVRAALALLPTLRAELTGELARTRTRLVRAARARE